MLPLPLSRTSSLACRSSDSKWRRRRPPLRRRDGRCGAHVYDATSKPLSSYCVFLVDAEKNYQNAYGFEFTDATGSFTLNYAGVTAAAGRAGAKKSAAAAAAAAAGAPAAPTQPATATPTVFLAVTNAKAQLVYFGAKALPLTVGSALYVDVSLPAGEPVLGDLPAEIRKVALPPTTK